MTQDLVGVSGGKVEESLCIDPPIHLEGRHTAVSVEVGGAYIPIGSQVAVLFASANHDDEVFPEPEEFNPQRPVGHLSFGHGIHTCPGMGLVRLEMAALLSEVLKQIPQVRLSGMPVDAGMIFGHHMGRTAMPAAVELRLGPVTLTDFGMSMTYRTARYRHFLWSRLV